MFEDLVGAELAAAIAAAAAGLADLPLTDTLDVVTAAERLIGWAHAVQADATNRMLNPELWPQLGFDPVVEIGAALGASVRSGNAKASFAWGLSRLPLARAALLAGQLSLSRVRRLILETQCCDDAVAAVADAELTAKAGRWSVAELGRRVQRLIAELDPDGVRKRRETKQATRCVQFEPGPDAMGWLSLYGPTEDLAAAYTAITTKALTARRAGDESPLGVLRFDAAIDLLTSSSDDRAPAGQPVVNLTVPVQTILGLSDAPGDIAGAGPVPAWVARKIAAETDVWFRLLTDPATGAAHSHDRRRYRPTEAMRNRVMERDRHCRAPGCDAPIWRCDADHDVPWPAGPTCACNLTTFCRRHHNAKTHGGWTTHLAADGTLTMTSPLGRSYTTTVEPLPQVPDWAGHTGAALDTSTTGPPEHDPDDQTWLAEQIPYWIADHTHLDLAA